METLGPFAGLLAPLQRRRRVRVVLWIVATLAAMVVVSSVLFHHIMALEGRDHSWVASFYWTLTTMTTLGYGDITFESDLGRAFSAAVLVVGALFLLVLLPFSIIQFIFAPWMDARDAARAPKRVADDLAGHVVVTQMDPVTQALLARTKRAGVPHVLIVEEPQQAVLARATGYNAIVGPLDAPSTYRNAGVDRAVLLASTRSDTANTNIAFTVREITDGVRVVATADKPASVDILELAGADHVIELPATLGAAMADRVLGTTGRTHMVGEFGVTRIAEAGARGTSLVGRTLGDADVTGRSGASVLAVYEQATRATLSDDHAITARTTLVLGGTEEQLAGYDAAFGEPFRTESPVLVLGGGRVGRAAARVFVDSGVPYTIVERLPERATPGLHVVRGDAADLDVLKAAGLEDVSTVLVTTHEDDMNVYLTLYCRRLRPDLHVIARATHERNVGTLYRAGADGVLSYASIGATAIWNDLGRDRRVVIMEGVELFLSPVPAALYGRDLYDTNVHDQTGCEVVALTDRDGTIIGDADRIPFSASVRLMVMGDRHAEQRFRDLYGRSARRRRGAR